jgi:hypothetical protein
MVAGFITCKEMIKAHKQIVVENASTLKRRRTQHG